jgi:molecular chaperone DnaK (HSP70)
MAKLGIDLGTSNSAAAVIFDIDEKNPVTIEPIEGALYTDLVFPSYVAFDKLGIVTVVGLLARERYFSGQSELVIRHFKRLIGRPYDYVAEKIAKGSPAFSEFEGRIKPAEDGLVLVTLGERDISVIEIASYLLKKIVEDTQVLLRKRGENIDAVTICLPAGFDDSQRQATMKAAKMAGLTSIDIQVLEEPTAAAIAKGLGGIEGKIMVVDVGAGTTDVVIGYMDTSGDGLSLVMTGRDCDDVLGGIDMDNLILDYIKQTDTEPPMFKDIYPELKIDQRLPLMGKIEETKIVASSHGSSAFSHALRRTPSKRIHFPLDEAQLASIVAPMINGYKDDGHLKGVRPVVERALLKAAGGKKSAVPKVTREIEHLILVGGPCRMECMHTMLKDIFRENENIVQQLDSIDRMDKFFMEGVAQGAALSQGEGLDITTTASYTASIFYLTGKAPVIPVGTSYRRVKGLSRSVSMPAREGSNPLWVLSEKESEPMRQWSMRRHSVHVPQKGDLKVTLDLGEGGVEADKAKVEGCGLPGVIEFPPMRDTATVGAELERVFGVFLSYAKDLQRLIQSARTPLLDRMLRQGMPAGEAAGWVDEQLYVSESDLQRCAAINPADKDNNLNDKEIELALNEGYFEMRDQAIRSRRLFSDRAIEVLDKAVSFLFREYPTSAEDLIDEAKKLLNTGQNCVACASYCQQLAHWLHQLELKPNDSAVASAAATSLGALADCLSSQRVISEEEFDQAKSVCWRFFARE